MPTLEPPTAKQIEQLIAFRDSANLPTFNHTLRDFVMEHASSKKYYDFDRGEFITDMVRLFRLLDSLETMK